MGICTSCVSWCCGKQEDPSQYGENGDRTQLIDPDGDCVVVPRNPNEGYFCSYPDPIYHRKPEEQSDLSKILQEMATNVIDVGTHGSHSLEQHESRERSNFYFQKMRSVGLSKSMSKLPKQCLLLDVPSPEKVIISKIRLPKDELNTICILSNRLNILDVLVGDMNIGTFDDLIVPFQRPA